MSTFCDGCGLEMAVAHGRMLQYWIARTGAPFAAWEPRLGENVALVCPRCDAYALGIEHRPGLAFYSPSVAAFLTLHDWDWWNRDPHDCDIRQWPDFGCLTFSEAAVRSTLEFLRDGEPDVGSCNHLPIFETDLIGPTGLPKDKQAGREWGRQLRCLRQRIKDEVSPLELNAAVRLLVGTLVVDPRREN